MTVIVRVVPDVSGLDKQFDYAVPDDLALDVTLGSIVRVPLHGRRVGAWVVGIDPADAYSVGELHEVSSVSSIGPNGDLIDLAHWAARRWVGRVRHFLRACSPRRVVASIPNDGASGIAVEPTSPATDDLLVGAGGLLELPPADDPVPSIHSALALGQTLVVEPSAHRCRLIAARLRRSGVSVAVQPDDWAMAAGGCDVVIGTRTAVWARCHRLAAIVVLDEHDEALQAEASPTWHARDVAVERARRAHVPIVLVSPTPTLTARTWAATHGSRRRPAPERVRRSWPEVSIVDRTGEEPWKRSLLTSELIQELRQPERTVVCVSNTTGRARLLACRNCRRLARCERCDAAVSQFATGAAPDNHEMLRCRRCHTERPMVCQACGHTALANVRPGVARLVEEISAAAGRPAVLIDGKQQQPPESAGVYVGTEAALHRVGRADTVAFLEFDRELLAPRYRAGEQSLALLARAARLVGPRRAGGKLLVQTFLPDHPALVGVANGDGDGFAELERRQRNMLGLPPYGAYAEVSGVGAEQFIDSLSGDRNVPHGSADAEPRPTASTFSVVADGDGYAIRASDWTTLAARLSTGVRPARARLRIAVDPPR